MTKTQKAKILAGQAADLLKAKIPLGWALGMAIGAAVLGVVAGPAGVAIFDEKKADAMIERQCDAVKAKADLDCARAMALQEKTFIEKLDQVRGEHRREIDALQAELEAVKSENASLSRQVLGLRKDVCALVAGLDGRPLTGCLE